MYAADFGELTGLEGLEEESFAQTPEYLLDIIVNITTILLSRLNLPEKEVEEFVSRIKERKMPELFEHFKGYDVQVTRKEAKEEGIKEGERIRLISVICRKLAKSKTEEEIAEALEEELGYIHELCAIARKYQPEYDVEAICRELDEAIPRSTKGVHQG